MARHSGELDAGARVIVDTCLRLTAGETLVVVADSPNRQNGLALARAGRERGAECILVLMEPRRAHAEDPPAPVIEAVCRADAVVFATTYSLSNSSARRRATGAGARVISIPGCSATTLRAGAIFADFRAVEATVRELGRRLSQGTSIQVTSDAGTDLVVRLCGRASVDQIGMAHIPGTWSPCPNIETAVGPDENGVDGLLVVDGCIVPGGVPRSPVRVTFRSGTVARVEGKRDASRLDALLSSFAHPGMYQAVEFGIGLNPEARIGRGLMAEDESQFGTVHVGLGEGRTFGVPISAPSHVDLVIRRPTVTIDGTVILRDERLLIQQ